MLSLLVAKHCKPPVGGGSGGGDTGGAADGGAAGAQARGGADGGGASGTVPWPLTFVTLSSECTPTCTSGTCYEDCAAGSYPCDSGCCSSAITSAEAPLGNNNVNATALAIDAADHAILAYTAEQPFLATSTDQSWEADTITGSVLPVAEDENGPRFTQLNRPFLALGNDGTAYVAYDMYDSATDSGIDWLSIGHPGGPYTHEELPSAPNGIIVANSGHIAVLFDHQILERTAASTFEAITPPTTAPLQAFVFTKHHYFVAAAARGTLEIHYRNAHGAWGKEQLPISPSASPTQVALVARHGTLYVSYVVGNELKLAHREPRGWQETTVPVPTTSVMQSAFTVDDCGAPHFLIWESSDTDFAGFDDRYLRWTAAGWRGYAFDTGCFFGDGPSLALTSTHAILAAASCTATIVTVPRAP